jgi:hypothetical protein
MSNQYIDYVDFDTNEECPIKRVGCMICNTTISERRLKQSKYKLVQFNSTKRIPVRISDNTYAELLSCPKCHTKELDFSKLTKTMHQGWLKEEKWKYETSTKPVHKKVKKQYLNLEPNDPLPLSYFKQIFTNKTILRKGVE